MNSNFDESVAQYKQFLAKQGFPRDLVWLRPADVLVCDRPVVFVRVPVPKENEQSARELFQFGLGEQKGVLFETICESKQKTFAFVWVPRDESEAEENLMPKGLKTVVTLGSSRLPAIEVASRLYWFYLRLKHRKLQATKGQLFHGCD